MRQVDDVCLVLEGTYPYVSGGVSSWVHDIIRSLPDLRFSITHIGPVRGRYAYKRYPIPANVTELSDLYCREPQGHRVDTQALFRAAYTERRRHADGNPASRVLSGLRRLHLGEEIGPELLDDLASGDLSIGAFLHGRSSFDLTIELCERLAPEASLIDVFWHFRSMHLPLIRLLGAPTPPASVYHAVCTGYAGLTAAVWSHRTGQPLLLTEHGIYTRERSMELSRAPWFRARRRRSAKEPARRAMDEATASALRTMWDRFFRSLAQAAYARASRIVALSEVNRRRQIADGAAPERTLVVPNGIDMDSLRGVTAGVPRFPGPRHRVRVGFVGRLVPIKDVITFIHACSLALRDVEFDARIIGPVDEDPAYVRRCRRLVAKLGLEAAIRFDGPLPIERIYAETDIVVLTSFSEGQPLVVLEANLAGIPVVVSDVGACRELVEGRDDADRRIGPSGIVTRIAAPDATAAAIVALVRDPALRRRLGAAGRQRVETLYRRRDTVQTYRSLYTGGPWQASAGASSA